MNQNISKKNWWKSKTIWMVVVIVTTTIAAQYGVKVPAWAFPIFVAAAIFFNRIGFKTLK